MISLTAAVAMAYFGVYDSRIAGPVRELDGETAPFAGTVCEWPTETAYGAKVTVKLADYPGAKAVYYGDADLLELQPGQILRGEATWHDTGDTNGIDESTFYARSVYALLYKKGDVTIEQGSAGTFRWWSQRVSCAVKEKINTLWQGDVAAVVMAELTGDKSGMSDDLYAAVRDVGLAHIFAVSGLHCAFLASLVLLFIPLFGSSAAAGVTVPLYALSDIALWEKIVFVAMILLSAVSGACGIILAESNRTRAARCSAAFGIVLSVLGSAVFIAARQPYAALLFFVLLVVKGLLLLRTKP